MRFALIGAIVVCASQFSLADDYKRVYHGLDVSVGKGAPIAKSIRYRYGELGWRERGAAVAGVGDLVRSAMIVPEEFEISWESESGKRYEFKVPVRSRIGTNIRGKTVVFLIKDDSLEAYLATPLPNYQDRLERFY